jgi:hypothetical protein
VITLRYGLDGGVTPTLSDVGKKFDLTRSRIARSRGVRSPAARTPQGFDLETLL